MCEALFACGSSGLQRANISRWTLILCLKLRDLNRAASADASGRFEIYRNSVPDQSEEFCRASEKMSGLFVRIPSQSLEPRNAFLALVTARVASIPWCERRQVAIARHLSS
jgi:hypothetical protein